MSKKCSVIFFLQLGDIQLRCKFLLSHRTKECIKRGLRSVGLLRGVRRLNKPSYAVQQHSSKDFNYAVEKLESLQMIQLPVLSTQFKAIEFNLVICTSPVIRSETTFGQFLLC
jgi:hypothetical protein